MEPTEHTYDWKILIPAVLGLCSALGAWFRKRKPQPLHLGLVEQLQELEELRASLSRERDGVDARIRDLRGRILKAAVEHQLGQKR